MKKLIESIENVLKALEEMNILDLKTVVWEPRLFKYTVAVSVPVPPDSMDLAKEHFKKIDFPLLSMSDEDLLKVKYSCR